MNQSGLTPADRKVVPAANALAKSTELPAAAMELPDGTIVTGKTTKLLGASAAVLLNALKTLAGSAPHTRLHALPNLMIQPLILIPRLAGQQYPKPLKRSSIHR